MLPVAETVHEACIDPSTLMSQTLYDHRDKGPPFGTVFALTRNSREFARPINICSLLVAEGRNSLFRAMGTSTPRRASSRRGLTTGSSSRPPHVLPRLSA